MMACERRRISGSRFSLRQPETRLRSQARFMSECFETAKNTYSKNENPQELQTKP